jgi:hypothetical protein
LKHACRFFGAQTLNVPQDKDLAKRASASIAPSNKMNFPERGLSLGIGM